MSRNRRKQRENHSRDQDNNFNYTRPRVEITPLTKNQRTYSRLITQSDIVFATGPAGCGKTYLAAQHAMKGYIDGEFERIVICRPIINAGGEQLGFLPGGINDKMDPYLRPIFDVFRTMWDMRTIKLKLTDNHIEVVPLAYMRGRTFAHTFIIADELQNATPEMLLMLLTRLGEGAKMIITGDPMQKDINNSCLDMARSTLDGIEGVTFMDFTMADVVRHPTVERILRAWHKEPKDEAPDFPAFIVQAA